MWAVHPAEPHRAALAPGDLVLIYIGPPESAFVGRAVLGSGVRDWSPAEVRIHPFGAESGVFLTDVEEWDPPVPMDAVVAHVDPTGTNPYVQANATDGFKNGVVLITEGEYEGVLAVRAKRPR
jgi:hypothetical protein